MSEKIKRDTEEVRDLKRRLRATEERANWEHDQAVMWERRYNELVDGGRTLLASFGVHLEVKP